MAEQPVGPAPASRSAERAPAARAPAARLRSLHRRHARQGGLRRSLRSLHRHPARERLGFVAHVRRVIHLHEMQTVLAGCGVCKNAGTCRLCHTGCGGYHRERCESYGGCGRNPECFHLVTFREPHWLGSCCDHRDWCGRVAAPLLLPGKYRTVLRQKPSLSQRRFWHRCGDGCALGAGSQRSVRRGD